ncbi:hypothetical protein ACFL0N_00395 [Pseudomonadota bacterium]
MPVKILTVLLLVTSLLFSPGGYAQETELTWPRDLDVPSGTVTMYQPQVDTLEGDILSFRAALSFKDNKGSEPVFGAAWFESRVEIDREIRNVHMVDLKVTDTRFPEGSEHVHGELAQYILEGLPTWDIDFSLDGLLTSLEASEEEIAAANNLKMDPPDIVYRDRPALLVTLDGEPILKEIENTKYQAVINTPYPLIFDGQRTYYLNAAKDVWYQSGQATGPWTFDPSPPTEISSLVNQEDTDADETDEDSEPVTAENAPEIVVTTEPAELIVSDGEPNFEPLVDDLLVLANSQSDVFMHVSEQNYYVVLSGRWYFARALNGPWTYRPSDELPGAFSNIPMESKQADSRVYVAGTDEAREAVMDAQIPQTAAIQKGSADLEVTYDGNPKFESIDGTSLFYAVNTASTVLKSGTDYYVVEDAVWYIGSSATGPWNVAESRPEAVEAIPPESPVYNVKYVYIYETTPEVVYVGYTPGYTGSYVYNSTIVYGTGWYYRPWISPYYYYPRVATWGFHINYNPWTGWGFGLSWGWGPFRVGFWPGGYWHRRHHWYHRHHGRWGPGGYRPRPVHYGNRNVNINNINVNRGNLAVRDNNLYRDKAQRANVAKTRDTRPGSQELRDRSRVADRSATSRPAARPEGGKIQASDLSRPTTSDRKARPSTAKNDVFTDRNGTVYRQTDKGWQKNDGKSWSNVPSTGTRDTTRPSTASNTRQASGAGTYDRKNSASTRNTGSSTRNSSAYKQSNSGYSSNRSSLDRQSYSRQRSSARSSQYSSHRARSGASRGGARRR